MVDWVEGSLLVGTVSNSPTSYYMHGMVVPSGNGDDNILVKNGLSALDLVKKIFH